MSDVKQVKVDNWGIYFLQRLKHFFNRTDYCDLTLQFQDNAQLKVHRLVLSACTEYFELLERTCEMYEDCLVMPDDLQADVVVPIINFMYTGQLEFRMDLLEKLYQTSLVMNMPVLTKLLDAHRSQPQPQTPRPAPAHLYGKRYSKSESPRQVRTTGNTPSSNNISTATKRSFSSASQSTEILFPKAKKQRMHIPIIQNKPETTFKNGNQYSEAQKQVHFPVYSERNRNAKEPRPTRYELPEELDEDNIFDNSFTSLSYTSKPLMVHPETTKKYVKKKVNLFEDGKSSSRLIQSSSTMDIVECKKIPANNSIFEDYGDESIADEPEFFQQAAIKTESRDSSQLFDQIVENVSIETDNSKQTAVNNLDHAKIISEVLKKYPHLVKSNKNIKLKILNTPNTSNTLITASKAKKAKINKCDEEIVQPKAEPDFTYETDVIDSKEAARLIALGAENVKGPWICLICGTPGKALHFTSYYNFRRHLVEIHDEKPVSNICEYCGLKSRKRNYLLHHIYTKHGVEPPPNYHFPKCNHCPYIALNEPLLVKHKMSHSDLLNFRCNVCAFTFTSSNQLLLHIQKTGHKYTAEKINLQCVYCQRNFLRESNLYAHLKTSHKENAKNDGIIEDSDDDHQELEKPIINISKKIKTNKNDSKNMIEIQVPSVMENQYEDNNVQYQIERRSDGNLHVISKKPKVLLPTAKHKILNTGFGNTQKLQQSQKTMQQQSKRSEFMQDTIYPNTLSDLNNDEIVVIDNNEYIVQDFQLIPKKEIISKDFVLSDPNIEESYETILPTSSSMEYHKIHNSEPKMMVNKSSSINQPLQIVVSSQEEYKALMNSNESVIFSDVDSNKMLTVLRQADDTTMQNETIDMDNTQSSEMMILPDQYPINVSEAVSTDNSNIVVVYSHPVEEANKQYQIITSQGIEPQFVQSSSIITQNYETINTCAPVVSVQNTIEESWQNNLSATISKMPITTSSELQVSTQQIAETVTITPNDSASTVDMSELPEVHLTSKSVLVNMSEIVVPQNVSNISTIGQSIVINPNNDSVLTDPTQIEQQSDVTLQENITEQHVSVIEPLPASSIDQVSNIIQETAAETTSVETTPIEAIVPETTPIIVDPATAGSDQIPANTVDAVFVEETLQDVSTNNVIENENLSLQSTLNPENSEQVINCQEQNIEIQPTIEVLESELSTNNPIPLNVDSEQIQDELMKHDEPTKETIEEETIENIAKDIAAAPDVISAQTQENNTPENDISKDTLKVVKEQIETLTSEWSEDENDAKTLEESDISKQATETKDKDSDEVLEMEESIENIQQEVEKQISCEIEQISEENTIPTQSNNDLQETQNTTESNNTIQGPQEKISSLLNDWDDNDSQENMSPINTKEIKDQNVETPINDDKGIKESLHTDEPESNKQDNIKNLVSDWDDDEEENKI